MLHQPRGATVGSRDFKSPDEKNSLFYFYNNQTKLTRLIKRRSYTYPEILVPSKYDESEMLLDAGRYTKLSTYPPFHREKYDVSTFRMYRPICHAPSTYLLIHCDAIWS